MTSTKPARHARRRIPRSRDEVVIEWIANIVLGVVIVTCLYPFLNIIAKSFSSDSPSVCSCQDLMGSSLPTAHVEAIAYKRPCPGHRRQKLVDRSRSLLYTPRYTPDIPCIPFPSPGPRENRSVFITR